MTSLKFTHSKLPAESNTYEVEVQDGQNVDVLVESMTDSGWRLVEQDGEKPKSTSARAGNNEGN